jgi:hypothetical protein
VMLRRAGVWSLRVVLALVALLLVLAVLTRQSADPALYPPRQDEPSVEIFVVSHGYHTGLALPRGAVRGLSGILCAGPVDHHARTNLSSNMMANWVFASPHSRGDIFHSAAV